MTAIQRTELKKFNGLAELSDDVLEIIMQNHPVETVPAGTRIIKLYSTDPREFYLISGSIRARNGSGDETLIDHTSPLAKEPILTKVPREREIIAASEVNFIMVPPEWERNRLKFMANKNASGVSRPKRRLRQSKTTKNHLREVKPIPTGNEKIFEAIENDLKNNALVVPSPPDIASKIDHYVSETSLSEDEIADILVLEPAIAIGIIQQCSMMTTCSDLHQAMQLVGAEAAYNRIHEYASESHCLTEHPLIREKLRKLWRQSVYVAIFSEIIAEKTPELCPQTAKTAGLVQGIGMLPLYNYIENSAFFFHLANADEKTIAAMSRTIGTMILKHWKFNQDIIDCAAHAEEWLRNSSAEAEYVDVVNSAMCHFIIMNGEQASLPPIDKIPAMKKVYSGLLNVKTSQQIIEEARRRIANMKKELELPTRQQSMSA
ncbi:MAG: HDOD domain-containing protein [Pseudomonadota bacterium]